jgi:ArsR family transcriptional regulator
VSLSRAAGFDSSDESVENDWRMELAQFVSEEAAELLDLSRFLVALGDPIRQQIVMLLSRERLNVNQLTSRVHLSRPAVSHQIKVLADAGLLVQERLGREHVYRVDTRTFRELVAQFQSFADRCCADAQS